MRTIKFRAWDKKRNRMKIGVESYLGAYLPPNGNIHEHHILMQYTGLHDKNGKEIYEGDICKTWRGVGQITFGLGGEGEPADYVGGYLGWCVGEDKWETNGFTNSAQIEIIGNIYENPELLNTSN